MAVARAGDRALRPLDWVARHYRWVLFAALVWRAASTLAPEHAAAVRARVSTTVLMPLLSARASAASTVTAARDATAPAFARVAAVYSEANRRAALAWRVVTQGASVSAVTVGARVRRLSVGIAHSVGFGSAARNGQAALAQEHEQQNGDKRLQLRPRRRFTFADFSVNSSDFNAFAVDDASATSSGDNTVTESNVLSDAAAIDPADDVADVTAPAAEAANAIVNATVDDAALTVDNDSAAANAAAAALHQFELDDDCADNNDSAPDADAVGHDTWSALTSLAHDVAIPTQHTDRNATTGAAAVATSSATETSAAARARMLQAGACLDSPSSFPATPSPACETATVAAENYSDLRVGVSSSNRAELFLELSPLCSPASVLSANAHTASGTAAAASGATAHAAAAATGDGDAMSANMQVPKGQPRRVSLAFVDCRRRRTTMGRKSTMLLSPLTEESNCNNVEVGNNAGNAPAAPAVEGEQW